MFFSDPWIQSQSHFSLDTMVVYRLKNDCQFWGDYFFLPFDNPIETLKLSRRSVTLDFTHLKRGNHGYGE